MGDGPVFKSVLAGAEHAATARPAQAALHTEKPVARAKPGRSLRPSRVPVSGPSGPVPSDGQGGSRVTGLPGALRSGIEGLAGVPLDDVRVHYRSGMPAQVGALAYTQGPDIHVGPGQEQHLAHEAWHVVQQKRGQVRPTFLAGGRAVSDDPKLEAEARQVGRTYQGAAGPAPGEADRRTAEPAGPSRSPVIQRMVPARAGSEKRLKDIYDQLVQRSLLLRVLGETVGKDRQVALRFGSDEELGGRDAAFLPEKHQILINSKHSNSPEREIKHYVLIELNHAREVIHKQSANSDVTFPSSVSAEEGNELYRALEALRVEYHEWISVYLTYIQTSDVNKYTRASEQKSQAETSDAEITVLYTDEAYATADEGWYVFDNYLEGQRETHTIAYDPKASDGYWLGSGLLEKARKIFGDDVFLIKDAVKPMDLSKVQGYEKKHIIDVTDYQKLLRRENPFKGTSAQQLINAYVAENDYD